MSRRDNIEQYIAKRRVADRTNIPNPNTNNDANSFQPLHLNSKPNLLLGEYQYNDSKRQCLQQLQRIRRNIQEQQAYIGKWLQNYEKKLFQMMDIQTEKIKRDICVSLDQSLAENKKTLRAAWQGYGARERMQIDTVRSEIRGIKERIAELERELQSPDYKRGIVEVIYNDFAAESDGVLERLADALTDFENTVYLRVNADILANIRQSTTRLFFIEDYDFLPKTQTNGSFRPIPNSPYQQPPPTLSPSASPQLQPPSNFGSTNIIYSSPLSAPQIPVIGSMNSLTSGNGYQGQQGPQGFSMRKHSAFKPNNASTNRPNTHLNRDMIQGGSAQSLS